MDVQIVNDYSEFNSNPLRVPDGERDAAPDAEFRFFRKDKDGARHEIALRRGYVPCETEVGDLKLYRTSADNQQRWAEAVARKTEAMTRSVPRGRQEDGLVGSVESRRANNPSASSDERADNPTNKRVFGPR